MTTTLTPLLRLLPDQARWIALIVLAIVLILICLLVTVVHAATDGPARRLCEVIRALRGVSAEPQSTMPERKSCGVQPDPPAPLAAGQLRHPATRAGRQGQSRPPGQRRSRRPPHSAKPARRRATR